MTGSSLLAFLVSLTLAGPGALAADEVLARVGDRTVTLGQYEHELRGYGLPEQTGLTRARRDKGLDATDPTQRRLALDNLVNRQLLALGALADVEGAAALRDSVREAALVAEAWLAVRRSLYPPAEELTPDAMERFRAGRTARWFGRQIVHASLDDVAATRKRLEAGEPFAEVAKEVSIDIGSRAAGGRIFPIRDGDTFPSLNELVFSLEPGEWGGPVETRMGYHLAHCDSVLHSFEDPVIFDDERLRYLLCRNAYIAAIPGWMNERAAEIGLEVHPEGVNEVVAHLWATPSNVMPPQIDPAWTPTDTPVTTAADGGGLSVAEFVSLFPALGMDDWPIPKNPVTVEVSARRLTVAQLHAREIEAGDRSLSDDAWARVHRRVNRALGQLYLDTEADPGVVDSVRAEEIFANHPEAFMVPESVSIAALGIREQKHAEELHDLLLAGVDFTDVARRGRELDPDSYSAPHTPFMPRGSFPEADSLLFSLKVGEVSDVLAVGGGYQIYKILQRRDERPTRRIELEDARLIERAQQVASAITQDEAIRGLRQRFPVVLDEEMVTRMVDGGSQ
jgi:hypothetical protein